MTQASETRPVVVVLDETPLSLITQRLGASPEVDHCREWLSRLLRSGHRVVVPAIAVDELRRELIRAKKVTSLDRLEEFLDAEPGRYLPVTREVLNHASELWAQARQQGRPTAPNDALDGDVIVAAQALSLGLPFGEFVIATSNAKHLSQFASSQRWQDLKPAASGRER